MVNYILRLALLIGIGLLGAVIALRTLFGPFTFPFKVTNPVNPEGWFGLTIVIMMLVIDDAGEETCTRSEPIQKN